MKNHMMALRIWRAACLATGTAFLCAPATQLVAQITTSSIVGVLRDASGAPVANATVTATHVPTGTAYTAVTSEQGRYNFINVIVGGPYTVAAGEKGAQSAVAKNVSAQLGTSSEVNLVVGESDVVVLDALEVTAASNDLNAASAGAGSMFSSGELATRPTSERSLADLVSASPFVTIRALSGDREEANITALGQNNRYNSFQIDGSRINDQFGLNSTGLASFFNPISVEWIEQLAVQVSPYDVRQAGFTGASINAVTKSGSNQFSGGSYYLFQGDNALGIQLRGENANEKTISNRKVVPKLEQSTYGFYLGGPIIPDRLFFFAGIETFERESAPRDATFSARDEAAILTRLAQYNTASGRSIPWGSAVTGSTSNISEDEKIILKLDWNIIDSQRVSVRYLTAEGEVPQYGRYGGTSLNPSLTGMPSSGVTTTPTGGFYSQQRKEESWAASLNSQWTPELKSELKYATTNQDQTTPTAVTAPEIYIFNLPGTNLQTGASVTNGGYVLGTEQFRHGNQINVATDQYSYVADYISGDVVYSAGLEHEQSDFYNLFRQGSYGRIGYTSLANFLNDIVAASERNVYDPAIRPVADVSEFATTGVFGQADWDISPRLKVTGGLRYEVNSQPDAPTFNQRFLTDTGFRNDGTLDGAEYVSPRLSFNYALDDKRVTQIRGGAGHFTGRAPWVFFSNSYGQTGVGSFTQTNVASTGLTNYLRNQFDPANPIGTGTDLATNRREINWVDGDIELPSVWRMNFAVDRKIEFLSTVASVEVVQTMTDNALFITNENLRPTTIGADGRQRFAGNPSTLANARFSQYTDLYRVQNSDVGGSRYLSLSWARPVKDKWGFNSAYVFGDSTEAQATGQTTASGQWQRNVVFNQGVKEEGTSDYEIRHRFQLSATRDFEFIKNWRSRVSVSYEGRTGNPYSYVYSTDLNGDGQSNNDRVAVPSGAADARFNFSGLSATQLDTYLANFRKTDLNEYAGGVAPKNAFREPFVNRLDLKLSQQIPVHRSLRSELFLDFINFGTFLSEDLFNYREQANLLSNDVFRRRTIGGASYGSDGRIVVSPSNVTAPSSLVIDNTQSRWRIQVGARITF